MIGPIHLRDCPMCKKPTKEDGVILSAETMIDLESGEAIYEIGYTARCCSCGVSISGEYLEETVRLWNGEPEPSDEEDEE